MKRIPVVNAFLVCDSSSRDSMTGKVSFFGIFKFIFTQQVPATHPSIVLYASLTDIEGEYDLWVDVVYVPQNARIARFPPDEHGAMRVTSNNPLDYVEVVFDIRGLTFSEFGEYEFRLFVDGRPLALRRIWVKHFQEAPDTLKGVI